LDLHLPPELRKLLEHERSAGHYASASDVVREALRVLAQDRKWRAGVRRKIAAGMAQVRAGRLVEGDRAVAKLRRRIGSRRGKPS